MATVARIFALIQISLFVLIIILAFIYSITVLSLQRFRCHINILTMNLSLTITCCSLYWMSYYVLLEFNIQPIYTMNVCIILLYAQMMCTIQVSLAFITISIHRLCSILYNTKHFFKTKQWLTICLISQWMIGLIVSLPMFSNYWSCTAPPWKRIYILIMIFIIPLLLCVIINGLIITYVRASSRRIQPQIKIIQTPNNNISHHQSKISHRDIHLLRNMFFMLCIFVSGYGPIHITTIIVNYISVNVMVMRVLSFIAELSLLCNIISIFVCNHQLRDYLKNVMLKYFGI